MPIRKIVVITFLCIFVIACQSDDSGEAVGDPTPNETEVVVSDELILNPSGYAPLSAKILLQTSEEARVSLKIIGKNGVGSDLVQNFPGLGTTFDIPVHGLYASLNNTVILSFEDGSGNDLGSKTYQVQTASLISEMPQITIQEAKRDQMAEGMTLVSYFGHNGSLFPQRPFIFDSYGDIRWYLDFSLHPQLNNLFYDDGIAQLANGNFYFGSGGNAFGAGGDNLIYEIDLFGNVINTWDMPGYGFHHEVLEKPNGNFLVTVNKLSAATIEDHIIEIDRVSKEIVNVWDLNLSMENTRTALTNDLVDWFHANAVSYDDTDDAILVSGRTQALVKLNSENEVIWIMGPHKDWGISGNGIDLNTLLLQPLDVDGQPIVEQAVLDGDENHPDFEWNWYQHAPLIMPNGNIMLFDNGDNRNFTGNEDYSRAVAFGVDGLNKTIQQVWQYGKERGEETYSRIVSDVDYLESVDHVLFSPGAVSFNGSLYGKSIEVDYDTQELIFEATITPPSAFFDIITLHRTERLSLYAN